MELFINSNFAQSPRGFRLMRLFSDGRFYDVTAAAELGENLFFFFSEDLLRAVWFEQAAGPGKRAHCLGLKGLTGVFNNGRAGTVELAVVLQEEEAALAPYLAGVVLNNYPAFLRLVFDSIAVDGAGEYTMDFAGLCAAFEALPGGRLPRFVDPEPGPNKVHLAVRREAEAYVLQQLAKRRLRPDKQQIIDEERFEKYLK